MTAITRRAAIAGSASLLAAPALARSPTPINASETLLVDGKVTTFHPSNPVADAVLLRDGRIAAVGTERDVRQHAAPDAEVIALDGRRVVPGLIDSHTHTVREGLQYALELRWDGIPTFAEAMARLREMVRRTPPGHWVRVVGGFSPEQFSDQPRMPTLEEINATAPDTPVYILFVYTSALVNGAALRALGIDRTRPDNRWPSARIERDGAGNPTGLLIADPAPVVLYATLFDAPRLSFEDALVSTRHFMREQNRLGITSTLDCGGGFQNWPDDYEVIRELGRRGELTVRIGASTFIQRPGRELEDFTRWTSEYKAGEGDDWFRLIGGGEMLVLSAYDYEIFSGPRVVPPPQAEAELEAVLRVMVANDWPFRFHATYGETIGRHLDVIERVHRDMPVDRLRWILDHGETISERDIDRVAALGGGISVQNRIAFQEREFLDRYGAKSASDAPPIRKMLRAGIPVGAGTDMSRVSSYNPWYCLEWLVTGRGIGGAQLLGPGSRLDRQTALKVWTDNAWLSNEDRSKGRIAPGLLADIAVLSEDYFAVPEEDIRHLESVLTFAGGKVAWGAGEFAGLMPELPPLKPDWSPVNLYGGTYRREA
ncbi:amidohydrolase [Acuticoccus yangtzensis]|uniref:amidohydrolase n=1 Tax=Acuticoccus yangtzensis TaxID=1443441 RepID=UPI0009F86199|nr:amidohydrolase [Acuticoccus yangtzensis]